MEKFYEIIVLQEFEGLKVPWKVLAFDTQPILF